MNLQLNAQQKRQIAEVVTKAGLDPAAFEFSTRESDCVFEYVRHAYDCLSGDEPTEAQGIFLTANGDFFFTFERDGKGRFCASCCPELEIGPNITSRAWRGLLEAFETWLDIVKLEIADLGTRAVPSATLADVLASGDLAAVASEFERAEKNCKIDPPAALTAACASIESVCKIYIEAQSLEMPTKQTVKPLWTVVRKHLFPSGKADTIADDIVRIASGITSVVDGIGSARTHASSAHGRASTDGSVDAATARLAVHSAHSLVLYILEKMQEGTPQ